MSRQPKEACLRECAYVHVRRCVYECEWLCGRCCVWARSVRMGAKVRALRCVRGCGSERARDRVSLSLNVSEGA